MDIVSKHYKKHTPIHWSGYSSSSTSFKNAKEFAGPDGVVMKITLYIGKTIRSYSALKEEDEVLLSPNMKLLVISDVYVATLMVRKCFDLVQPRDKTFVF